MGRKKEKEWGRTSSLFMQNQTLCLTYDVVTIVLVLNETIQITEVTENTCPAYFLVLVFSRHLCFLGLFQLIFLKEGPKKSSENNGVTIKHKAILSVGIVPSVLVWGRCHDSQTISARAEMQKSFTFWYFFIHLSIKSVSVP